MHGFKYISSVIKIYDNVIMNLNKIIINLRLSIYFKLSNKFKNKIFKFLKFKFLKGDSI